MGDDLYLDLETTSPEPHRAQVLVLSLADRERSATFVVGSWPPSLLAGSLRAVLPRVRVVGHNLQYDLRVLGHLGVWADRVWDTYLAECLLTAGLARSRTLSAICQARLGRTLDKGVRATFVGVDPRTFVPTPEQLQYALEDVLVLRPLLAAQERAVRGAGLERVCALEMEFLSAVVVPLLVRGVEIDRPAWEREVAALEQVLQDLQQTLEARLTPRLARYVAERVARSEQAILAWQQAYEEVKRAHPGRPLAPEVRAWRQAHPRPARYRPPATISLRSPQQMRAALADLGLVLPDFRASTLSQVRADGEVGEVVHLVRQYARVHKLVTAFGRPFLAALDEKGRVYGEFVQILATGRMARRSPNLQTIPDPLRLPEGSPGRAFRSLFLPPPGWRTLVADYSQIEPRIAVDRHGELSLVRAYEAGQDIYLVVASALLHISYEEACARYQAREREMVLWRQLAKRVLLGTMYGMGPGRLSQQGVELGDGEYYRPSRGEACAIIAQFEASYPRLARGLARDGREGLVRGFTVTRLGRRRYFVRDNPYQVVRQARNAPIQGESADITKLAAVMIARTLPRDMGYIWNLVHDEIDLFINPQHEQTCVEVVRSCMEQAARTLLKIVPVRVEVRVTDRWGGH